MAAATITGRFQNNVVGARVAVGASSIAFAATKGDGPAKATYGAVSVLNSAATKVFTGMIGRNAFAIFNHGPNTIWCGWKSNVTTATGFPVIAEATLGIDLVYNGTGDTDFYCIASSADQATPLDTRWIQVK